MARVAKAAGHYPTETLRPVVRGQSLKYNTKLRYGKGFTYGELKKVNLTPAFAKTIGIAVDHRRQDVNEETMQRNVDRLNSYKSKLVLFPRHEGKIKKGEVNDATAEQVKAVAETVTPKNVLAFPAESLREKRAVITDEMKKTNIYKKLRSERTNARYFGKREERAKREAEEKK